MLRELDDISHQRPIDAVTAPDAPGEVRALLRDRRLPLRDEPP